MNSEAAAGDRPLLQNQNNNNNANHYYGVTIQDENEDLSKLSSFTTEAWKINEINELTSPFSFQENVTQSNKCYSCCRFIINIFSTLFKVILALIFIPLVLVFILLYFVLYICTFIGYLYEKYAIHRDETRCFQEINPSELKNPLEYFNQKDEEYNLLFPSKATALPNKLQIHQLFKHNHFFQVIHLQAKGLLNINTFGKANNEWMEPEDKENLYILYISGLGASMFIVRKLIQELLDNLIKTIPSNINVHIISFESPGYGISSPYLIDNNIINNNELYNEFADLEIELINRVAYNECGVIESENNKNKQLKKFFLLGASAGGTLVDLYRKLFPSNVYGALLYDPTPPNAYDVNQSPMGKDFNGATNLYNNMAIMARIGFLRPLISLMKNAKGEFGEIFRKLPKDHIAFFMTEKNLVKTGQHFGYWKIFMERSLTFNDSNKIDQITKVPLILITALNWGTDKPHGGLNKLQMKQFWFNSTFNLIFKLIDGENNNIQGYHTNSSTSNLPESNKNNWVSAGAYIVRHDLTHADLMLNMNIASKALICLIRQVSRN